MRHWAEYIRTILRVVVSDFAHAGKYPHDDQLDDFKDCIGAASSRAPQICRPRSSPTSWTNPILPSTQGSFARGGAVPGGVNSDNSKS